MEETKVILTVEDSYDGIDGFKVEELIRTLFDLPENVVPETLVIGYNDLVNYTSYIMGSTMDSALKNVELLKKRNNDIT